jgi:hypothetical protein
LYGARQSNIVPFAASAGVPPRDRCADREIRRPRSARDKGNDIFSNPRPQASALGDDAGPTALDGARADAMNDAKTIFIVTGFDASEQVRGGLEPTRREIVAPVPTTPALISLSLSCLPSPSPLTPIPPTIAARDLDLG